MFYAALLMLAGPETAAEAEAAFARAAQMQGQWTAFRAFAAPGALMFSPQPVAIEEALNDLKDPPSAVQWWASDSFVSCDGRMAVNTGPWSRNGGRNGFFTTVWRRGDDGWKWTLDAGGPLPAPRAARDRPLVTKASCRGKPMAAPAVDAGDGQRGEGTSADGTLAWRWHVATDGARTLDAWLWDGKAMRHVIADRVAAPPAR